ncbi:centromere protein H [Amia ocellicauda]|uniref:centromere protein H n=1 Tax=Amia ocellicauda TaxID=2972642 RepID=UPI0034647738
MDRNQNTTASSSSCAPHSPVAQPAVGRPGREAEEERPTRPLMKLVELREQMKQQYLDMKTWLALRNPVFAEETTDPSLSVSMENVETPYESLLSDLRTKQLAVHRMQCAQALLHEIQKNRESDVQVSVDLCQRIASIQKENRELRSLIGQVSKRRFELKMVLQSLLHTLRTQAEVRERAGRITADSHTATQAYLDQSYQVALTLQEVFRRLILCAKINWVEDPKLLSAVLSMKDSNASE